MHIVLELHIFSRNAYGIYGTARGSVDRVRFPCFTSIWDRISAAPPRCSSDAHSLGNVPRRVSGEQRGGAAEILSRIGVGQGERTRTTGPRVG